MRYLALTLLFALPAISISQSSLDIPTLMQGEKFVGSSPSGIYWHPNSRSIYFSWNPELDSLPSLYQSDIKGNTPQKLSLTERGNAIPRSQSFNLNRTLCTFALQGDIYLLDLRTGTQLQITQTVNPERNPTFSQDELFIYYEMENNLYAWSIDGGYTRQLTQFIPGKKKPKNPKKPDYSTWLERDQLAYFDILEERKKIRELREKNQKVLKGKQPSPIYLGDKEISSLQIGPQGRFISYRLSIKPQKSSRTQVPDFVTQSGYVRELSARSKVGSPQYTYQTWIYDAEEDSTYQIGTDALPGIRKKPSFLLDYHRGDSAWVDTFQKSREVIIHSPVFTEDGRRAALVVKSQDNKDRWIAELDLETGELEVLDHQRDEAWIGGPGIASWNLSPGNLGWLGDGKTLWFQSEETGYSHLYSLHVPSKQKKALTSGSFEVQEAFLSQDKSTFYLLTNEKHPGEKHLYRMSIAGGEREQITQMTGAHQVYLSPDEKYIAFRYSSSTHPWELYLMPNKPKGKAKQLTESTTPAFKAYAWREPQLIQFEATDGAQVPARLYRPDSPKPQGPAVIFVHGAGYLQNAHKWWSSYYREYMFHNFLVDKGYTVLDIDFRGSAGYGRDWRVGIYRHMGGKDLSDQVDGAQFLVDSLGVDPDRIGMYGGSYGGFITLMALFTHPGTFACGAALRSVTDWAHYNHPYTSNILNTPVEDSLSYRKSSPIYHAEGLADPLLILHGMVDTNVQFQDVVRLSQRLIELEKDNWELAVFPMEGHGFREASSWTDEYKRIFKLFEMHLKE